MRLECHCGNVAIAVAAPSQLTECNCSICSRYSALWGYYLPEKVAITVGAAGVHTYSHGDRELEFVRCTGCGCVTHYRVMEGLPDPKIAVNFRLAAVALTRDIPRRFFDGASLPQRNTQ